MTRRLPPFLIFANLLALLSLLTPTQTFSTFYPTSRKPSFFKLNDQNNNNNNNNDDPISAAITSLIPYVSDSDSDDSNSNNDRGTWNNDNCVQIFTPTGYTPRTNCDVVFLGGFVLGSSSKSFYSDFVTQISAATNSRVLCVNYQSAKGQPLDHYAYAERAKEIMKKIEGRADSDGVDLVGHR